MKLIFDSNQLLYASYAYNYEKFIQRGFTVDDVERTSKEKFITDIMTISKTFNSSTRDIILAFDHSSWRKEYFPFYKFKRKENREKSEIDMERMKNFFNSVFVEMKEYFPFFKPLKVFNCEGDDIIATMVHNKIDEKIAIISRDHDFLQLLENGIFIFDPITRKLIKSHNMFKSSKEENNVVWKIESSIDAMKFLLFHILIGDSGDGVPNVLCDDDVFQNPAKTPRQFGNFGPKKILKDFFSEDESSNIENLRKLHNEYPKNFDRNSRLIDLRKIPNHLKQLILNELKSYDKYGKEIDSDKCKSWFIENGFHDLYSYYGERFK